VSNDSGKIRIGSFDYPLPFLSNLIDSIRDEYPSFSGDMLRLWENSESQRLQEADRNAERETERRQIESEKQQEYKSE